MSTNDDSASRRGRRADQEDRRPPAMHRWEQPTAGRESQAQRGQLSGFSRHAYPPQRQDPPLSPPQQRAFEPAPAPPVLPQGYNPDPTPRTYPDQMGSAYSQQPYEPTLPNPAYHSGGREDLFAREPAPQGYDPNAYDAQASGYRTDPYAGSGFQPGAQSPLDEYDRSFAARATPQDQTSSLFLPEHQPPLGQGYSPAMQQNPVDYNYAQTQQYPHAGYAPNNEPHPNYAPDQYDPRYAQDGWGGADPYADERHRGLPQRGGDEVDEDFFPDEEEFDQDIYQTPRRGRKKLIAAALVGAIAVGGGGAYLYKGMKGGTGESAPAVIRADSRPSKEMPGNPGGKQFPNGEKAIYDRLTPNGQQIQAASFGPGATMPPTFTSAPASGNSLEDRIEEALKKAQRTGDAPPAQGQNGRPDQPTVVRSESYRPDGTRVDSGRPMVTPSIVNVNGGQLPPPFGNGATQPVATQAPAAPFRATPVPSTSTQTFAAAVPAQKPAQPAAPSRTASITPAPASTPTPAAGFYVSLKSAADEKAIQREIPGLSDKYKSVLGDIQLTSKIADLGAKGVKYRAVAGPLSTKQEAMELCQKIKGAGGDCFVTN